MSVYDQDSSASAVVLADYGKAYFTLDPNKGFQLNMDRITRIKILNKNGLSYADQQVVLYHRGVRKEEVFSIKGVTYNLEGGKVSKSKLGKKQIFREKHSENFDVVKFSMPNVKEGSIIEFRYTQKTDFIYNFFTWEFQREIPVRWSEFRAKVPEYFYYKNFLNGYVPVGIVETESYKDSFRWTQTTNTSNGAAGFTVGSGTKKESRTVEPLGTRYRWAMEKVPAIRKEAYVTTMRDYMAKLDFELSYTKFPGSGIKNFSNSWEKLSEEFMDDERFGKRLGKARFLRDVLPELLAGAVEEEEKIARITHYVKKNFHFNGENRVYAQNSLRKVFDEKEGSSAEINLLLVVMLQEAGLQAHPVILSTRDHGRVNPYVPMEKDFNFVVAYVKLAEGYILVEGTDPDLPYNMLPFQCLNQKGRLISSEFSSWVPLLNKELSKETTQAELTLSEDGQLLGQLSLKHSGFSARDSRKKYAAQGEKTYLEEVYGKKGWGINNFEIEQADIPAADLVENMSLNISDGVTLSGTHMYFHPLLLAMENENPFKLDVRNFPVDFGCPLESMGMIKIKLPEGYTVEEMPEPLALNLPDMAGTFRFSVSQLNNELTVVNMLKINKVFFLPEEYLGLKEFFNQIVAKHSQQVVIKKMN